MNLYTALKNVYPLPPSDAVWKNILDHLSSSVLSQFKKSHPPWKPEI